MRQWMVLSLIFGLGLPGCTSNDSGSSEPPSFNPTGTWGTTAEASPLDPLVVTLNLWSDDDDPASIRGQWGSMGDDCFSFGSTDGYSGSMSGNRITLWLSYLIDGQTFQMKADLDGLLGQVGPARLSGQYTILQHPDSACLERPPKAVLLDCDLATSCGGLLPPP